MPMQPMLKRALIISVLAMAIDAASIAGSETPAGRSCDPEGPVANLDFTVKDMGGKSVALSTHKGKVLVLNFWATWCAACKLEVPGFVELQKAYSSQGLSVLGLSVDDSPAKLKAFAKEFRMNYPVLVGDGRKDLLEAFGSPESFPTTFVIDRDGKVCKVHSGYTPKEQIENEIHDLL